MPFNNVSEQIVEDRLLPVVAEYGCRLNAKTRFADVVGDLSALPDGVRAYCLMAHVDFAVVDPRSRQVLLVVEYDGPVHDDPGQQMRDAVKRMITDACGIPTVVARGMLLGTGGIELLIAEVRGYLGGQSRLPPVIPLDQLFPPQVVVDDRPVYQPPEPVYTDSEPVYLEPRFSRRDLDWDDSYDDDDEDDYVLRRRRRESARRSRPDDSLRMVLFIAGPIFAVAVLLCVLTSFFGPESGRNQRDLPAEPPAAVAPAADPVNQEGDPAPVQPKAVLPEQKRLVVPVDPSLPGRLGMPKEPFQPPPLPQFPRTQ